MPEIKALMPEIRAPKSFLVVLILVYTSLDPVQVTAQLAVPYISVVEPFPASPVNAGAGAAGKAGRSICVTPRDLEDYTASCDEDLCEEGGCSGNKCTYQKLKVVYEQTRKTVCKSVESGCTPEPDGSPFDVNTNEVLLDGVRRGAMSVRHLVVDDAQVVEVTQALETFHNSHSMPKICTCRIFSTLALRHTIGCQPYRGVWYLSL
jgi:hypothetical protein